jgi:hypothetical protein
MKVIICTFLLLGSIILFGFSSKEKDIVAEFYNQLQGEKYQILGEFNGFIFAETEEQLSKGTSFAFGANVGGYGFGMVPTTYFYSDYGQDAQRLHVWKTLFYRGQGTILRDKGTSCIVFLSKSAAFTYGGLG